MDDPLSPPTRRAPDPGRWVVVAALLFVVLGLLVQAWRLWSLTASYDQGIFLQVFWNSWHGHPFESSLSSQLSSSVLHQGALPDPAYRRLGQHFTPALLLWVPLVPLLGAWSLPVVQVGLITSAGLVLHRLARGLLPAGLATAIACSWYAAQAVIGPTWCNFHDLCQLPLLVFALLAAADGGAAAAAGARRHRRGAVRHRPLARPAGGGAPLAGRGARALGCRLDGAGDGCADAGGE
jgi:uncharacterized membrane protein